ncbi:hypothetical protein KCP71_25470 [Salmonella enterica subsp. enterica]|nr:hypothetical protein KCP71_25470 [Salmonella enterica subsp. enterica]
MRPFGCARHPQRMNLGVRLSGAMVITFADDVAIVGTMTQPTLGFG